MSNYISDDSMGYFGTDLDDGQSIGQRVLAAANRQRAEQTARQQGRLAIPILAAVDRRRALLAAQQQGRPTVAVRAPARVAVRGAGVAVRPGGFFAGLNPKEIERARKDVKRLASSPLTAQGRAIVDQLNRLGVLGADRNVRRAWYTFFLRHAVTSSGAQRGFYVNVAAAVARR